MSKYATKEQLISIVQDMASKISVPTIGIGGGYAPIGTVISYMGVTAPQDYLACNGSTYNISAYSDLADFFQAQFGSKNYFGGDGVTTFGVPTLTGAPTNSIYCIKAVATGDEFYDGTGTEIEVGVYIDPNGLKHKLYKKMFVTTDFSNKTTGNNASTISTAHGISSLGDIVSMYGVVKFSYDNGATWSQRPMNGYIMSSYDDFNTIAAKDKMSVYVNINSTNYNQVIGNDILSKYGVKTTFTILYTKA